MNGKQMLEEVLSIRLGPYFKKYWMYVSLGNFGDLASNLAQIWGAKLLLGASPAQTAKVGGNWTEHLSLTVSVRQTDICPLLAKDQTEEVLNLIYDGKQHVYHFSPPLSNCKSQEVLFYCTMRKPLKSWYSVLHLHRQAENPLNPSQSSPTVKSLF